MPDFSARLSINIGRVDRNSDRNIYAKLDRLFCQRGRKIPAVSDNRFDPEKSFGKLLDADPIDRQFRKQFDRIYFLGMSYLWCVYQSAELWH